MADPGTPRLPKPSPLAAAKLNAPPQSARATPRLSPAGAAAAAAAEAPPPRRAPRMSVLMSPENLERMQRFISSPQGELGSTVSTLVAANELKSRVTRTKKKRMVRSLRARYQAQVTEVLEEEAAQRVTGLETTLSEQKLGPRSRYGDGDGSFWDRWLVYERCVPARSSYSSGSVKPMSGFKRQRQRAVRRQPGWDQVTKSEFSVTSRDGHKPIVERVLASVAVASPAPPSAEDESDEDEYFSDEAVEPGDEDVDTRYLRQGLEMRAAQAKRQLPSLRSTPRSSTAGSALGSARGSMRSTMASVSGPGSADAPPALQLHAVAAAAIEADPSRQLSTLLGSSSPRAQRTRVESALERQRYFGQRARANFFDAFREVASSTADQLPQGFATVPAGEVERVLRPATAPVVVAGPPSPSDSDSGSEPDQSQSPEPDQDQDHDQDQDPDQQTARLAFLKQCKSRDILPEPMVVRKLDSTSLNLQHYGLGDNVGGALADSLSQLPRIQHVDLSDNRLSGAVVNKALEALGAREDLLSLDLSRNRITASVAPQLAVVLRQTPSLQHLTLTHARLGDRFVGTLCGALEGQRTLSRLDLGHNRIGDAGARTLGQLLLANGAIRTLELQWNSIRGPGGAAMVEALHSNSTLRSLNVAHNGFADAGCYAVAEALQLNATLAELDLGHNHLTAKGAMVLLHALENTDSLQRLSLAGNAIGFEGAAVALNTSITGDVTCALDLEACNINIRYGDAFDLSAPEGRYRLVLAEPYDLAVAKQILRLTEQHTRYALADVSHSARGRVQLQREDESALAFDSPAVPPFIDAKTGFPFQLPDDGVLELVVEARDRPPIRAQAVRPAAMLAVHNFLEVRGQDAQESVVRKLEVVSSSLWFTARQVCDIVRRRHNDYRVRACAALVPRIVDSENATPLLEDLLLDHERFLVARQLGPLFYFNRLHPSGRYELMLERQSERQLALRLLELSNARALRQSARVAAGEDVLDTSQGGNWSAVRNARLDKKKWTAELDQRVPRVGRLRFDFALFSDPASTEEEEQPAATDQDADALVSQLERCAAAAQRRFAQSTPPPPTAPLDSAGSDSDSGSPRAGTPRTPGSGTPSTGRAGRRGLGRGARHAHHHRHYHLSKDPYAAPSADFGAISAAVSDLLLKLRGRAGALTLTCAQLSRLATRLLRFPGAVETAVPAFVSRLADPGQFARVVVGRLPAQLRARLCDRVGWLNAWTPAAPDGEYTLALACADERAVAGMLAALAVADGKDEAVSAAMYRPKPKAKLDRHWQLPDAWARGAPEEGVFTVAYHTPRDADRSAPFAGSAAAPAPSGGRGKKNKNKNQNQQRQSSARPANVVVVPPDATLREGLALRVRAGGRPC